MEAQHLAHWALLCHHEADTRRALGGAVSWGCPSLWQCLSASKHAVAAALIGVCLKSDEFWNTPLLP